MIINIAIIILSSEGGAQYLILHDSVGFINLEQHHRTATANKTWVLYIIKLCSQIST